MFPDACELEPEVERRGFPWWQAELLPLLLGSPSTLMVIFQASEMENVSSQLRWQAPPDSSPRELVALPWPAERVFARGQAALTCADPRTPVRGLSPQLSP